MVNTLKTLMIFQILQFISQNIQNILFLLH
jgi:hypothetical protein